MLLKYIKGSVFLKMVLHNVTSAFQVSEYIIRKKKKKKKLAKFMKM